MNVFDLVASLSLDTKEYERALYTAKGTTTRATQDIGARVDRMKKGFLIGAGAMAAGFAAFGVSSVKTGMQFDSAMSQVAATMGKSNDEMLADVGEVDLAWGHFSGNLRDYAKEMGAHTKFSATESAEALNYMALAGYDAQKSMEMLPSVLNLAAAGNMDLARASDMVTDASSALGLSQEETAEMVDKMAMAASKSNTSVEQLGDAYLTVGGTAKSLKGGTTELSTALGILADNGIKGSEGGTILRNAILSLTSPTSKAKKELDALGVSAFDSEGNMRGLDEIFGDLNGSLSNLTGEERAAALGKIFNKRDLKGIEALLGNVGGRWDELSGYIDDAEGSAQKMADTQLDNLEGDITLLKSAFEGLKISVSDKLTPALRKGVKALTWMIDHAKTLGPIILGVATAFTVFAVAINIGNIIRGVTTAMAALNAVLLANPIGIVVALIAGLIVAFVALWKNNEEFRKKVTAIWTAVKRVFVTVFNDIKTSASKIWSSIKDNIIKPVTNIYNSATQLFNKLKTKVTSILNGLKSTASKIWSSIKEKILSIARSIHTTVTTTWNRIKSVITTVWKAIKTVTATVWKGIKTVISNAINTIKTIISTAVKTIKGKMSFSGLVGKVKEVFNGAKSAISNAINSAKRTISNVVGKIKSTMSFGGLVNKVKKLFNSVKSAITSPINTAKDTVNKAINKIKSVFPVKLGKIFSGVKLPHFKISGGKVPWGIGGKGTKPSVSIEWYKKAANNPYMFSGATLFGAGETVDEVLYGKSNLMKDITQAVINGNNDQHRSESIVINLNYDASADANEMVRDIARGINRYRMAGAF